MARPHPVLFDLAAGRPARPISAADGPALLASALEHRMTGLLWSAARRRELELHAAESLELARQDLAVERHHLRLWETAREIERRLSALGIGVAFAKGVVAECRWYDRIGERPSADLDLLLDPKALPRLGEVIDTLQPDHVLRRDATDLVTRGLLQSVDLTLNGISLDVHADIFKIEIPTRQIRTVWDRRVMVSGPRGILVPALDPESSLIHFLLHLTKDRFSRLLGFADIARILKRDSLDWTFIDAFLSSEGLREPVYAALHAVTKALDLPSPVNPPTGWRAKVWSRLWPPDQRLLGHRGLAQHQHRQLVLPLLVEGRAAEGVRWLLRRRLLPPRAMVPIWYPDTSGPYLVRVVTGRVLRARDRRRLARQFR